MKKTLSIILALALSLALSVPAFAENSTGDTTELTYTVESSYSVTIPESITLAPSGGALTGSGDFSVDAGALIEAGKTLKMAITSSANYNDGFYLVNASGNSVKLGYTIANGDDPVTKDAYFLTVGADTAFDSGASETLTVTSEAYKQAGTYSDTLTTTVSLVDAA